MGFDYSHRNKRWQTVRAAILRRDGYQCQESRRYGLHRPAEIVHHIWPAEDYPQYAYEPWNLVSLSLAAHDAMHNRQTQALTALGKAWQRKHPPPP